MKNDDLKFIDNQVQAFRSIMAHECISLTNIKTREFLYASRPLLRLINCRNADVVGLNLGDLKSPISAFVEHYRLLQDRFILYGNKVKALVAHDVGYGTGVRILERIPVRSPTTDRLIAALDRITPINMTDGMGGLFRFFQKRYGGTNHFEIDRVDFDLTKREQQILFLLFVGKSPANISDILYKIENKQVLATTIMSIINKRLYKKFNVKSTSELIEKAVALDLIRTIPHSLLTQQGILAELE